MYIIQLELLEAATLFTEHLTADQEDTSSNPLRGRELSTMTIWMTFLSRALPMDQITTRLQS
jgi:hypothetical protein